MADTAFYKETEGYISRYTARKKVNEATLKRLGYIWIRNLIYNMDILPESGALQELENHFPDIPVLMLAAGPSLTPLFPLLKKLFPPPEQNRIQEERNILRGVELLVDELEQLSSLTAKSIQRIIDFKLLFQVFKIIGKTQTVSNCNCFKACGSRVCSLVRFY